MIISFAIRNVLRNRKRSFLTFLTILFAAMLTAVSQSWVNGILNLYVTNFTKYQTGHLRVTTEEYVKREKFMPVDEFIYDAAPLMERLSSMKGVKRVEERIRFGILLGHGETTVQAMGMGIDLKNNIFDIGRKIREGSLEESGIYIGYGLAEKLGVRLRDEILLATKTSQGGLNGIKLGIRGIFNMGMLFDKKLFFIGLPDARRLLKLNGSATEIYVYLKDIRRCDEFTKQLSETLPAGLTARTYKEQMGEFFSMLDSMKSIYAFIEILILSLASFVIINTMMMAIFERLREIGTMKAMGMTDMELFLTFTCEGAILGTAGGIIGSTLGFLVIMYLGHRGIDMSSQFAGIDMPFEYIIKPAARGVDLFISISLSIIVTSMAAMIPARFARRLTPAEALRK